MKIYKLWKFFNLDSVEKKLIVTGTISNSIVNPLTVEIPLIFLNSETVIDNSDFNVVDGNF